MKASPHDLTSPEFRVLTRRGGSVLFQAPQGLRLAASSLTAIIGPNGAGKTSLLRGAGGFSPSQGTISLGNQALDELSAAERARLIAIQPQGRPRAEGLTVREYVAASLGAQSSWLIGVPKESRQQIDQSLEGCGAIDYAERRLSTLSGGEAARVALAATLVGGAKWLLLDEPCAALDPGAAHQLWTLFQMLVEKDGYSIAVVEHDLAMARSFASQALLIGGGELIAQGAVADVMEEARLSEVYASPLRFIDAGQGSFALAIGGEA